MRKQTLVLLLIGLVGVMMIVGGIYYNQDRPPSDYRNSGRLVFETEEGYADFKRVLGNEDIGIVTMTILSSYPPIVVDYSVFYPSTVVFPYGEAQVAGLVGGIVGALLCACGGTFICGAALWGWIVS